MRTGVRFEQRESRAMPARAPKAEPPKGAGGDPLMLKDQPMQRAAVQLLHYAEPSWWIGISSRVTP